MAPLNPDDVWERWARDFDEVVTETKTLFHTRWMWITLTEMLKHAQIEEYVVVQNHLVRTYAATMCVGIRREADLDTHTTSLARCLRRLIDGHGAFTRQRYFQLILERIGDHECARALTEGGFSRYAPQGVDAIDVGLVKGDLARLSVAVASVKKYTDERLAHRQRTDGQTEPITVTFDEINSALDELGGIVKHYYGLRFPGQMLVHLTPAVNPAFLNMFKTPWYLTGFQIPDEIALG